MLLQFITIGVVITKGLQQGSISEILYMVIHKNDVKNKSIKNLLLHNSKLTYTNVTCFLTIHLRIVVQICITSINETKNSVPLIDLRIFN